MRSTTFFALATAATLALGACGDDSVTAPSAGPGTELAKGGGGRGKGGKAANRIVYTHSEQFGLTEIYSMNPNGSGVTRLTTGPGTSSWSPRWTPDHGRIVFVSNRNTGEEIFVMDADGSNATQLTFNDCCDRNPVVSPDGTRIAFQRLGAGIFVMNLDGSNPTQMTFDPGDVHPTWKPDGSRILFANIADTTHAFWKVNADGSNRAAVYSCGSMNCQHPAYSPDGTKLAYWSDKNGGEIIVHDLVTAAWHSMTQLGNGSTYPLAWSPDGSRIAFTALADGSDFELFTASAVDGTGITRVTSVTGVDAAGSWHR